MSHTALRIERDEAIAHLVLTGPGKGNAMGPRTWTDLPAAFDELEADPAVRAVVISGHGEHFSFGLDVPAMLAAFDLANDRGANARYDLLRQIELMQHAFTRVAESPLPVIAAVSGWCIGSGVELACACDIRYAQNGARFSLREVQLAIVADLGGLQRLPGIVGEGNAREMALTGMNVDALRAERFGLVSAVVPEVIAHAVEIARTIARYSPPTVRGIKANMNAQPGKSIAEGLHAAAVWNAAFMQSADFRAALEAFGTHT
ncbi:MAG: crotonase/enoyl-CoA hydratase family protein [Candidatus Velthaea sp.]